MDLVRRLAAKRFVRSVLIVPADRESYFALEFRLVFGNCDQPQEFFQGAVEPFHHGDATSLADRSKSRQDVLGFAPGILEVLALELATLIDNQVLYLLSYSPFSNAVVQ